MVIPQAGTWVKDVNEKKTNYYHRIIKNKYKIDGMISSKEKLNR